MILLKMIADSKIKQEILCILTIAITLKNRAQELEIETLSK